jgi:hypothetical protein
MQKESGRFLKKMPARAAATMAACAKNFYFFLAVPIAGAPMPILPGGILNLADHAPSKTGPS